MNTWLAVGGALAVVAWCAISPSVQAQEERPHGDEALRGKWTELDGRRGSRVFVAPTGTKSPDGLPRIHFRYDRAATADQPMVSEVETLDVDCYHGETRLVAVRAYEEGNKLIGEKTYPEPQTPQRILEFYHSPLGQFCSGEYYVKTIPGGWETALAARRMLAARNRSELPDRAIPVPK